jgi:peptidoglycan/LPS O-acetylase OafA/YrhL
MVAPIGIAETKLSRQNTYLPTLDGWRAVAVIGVILFHGRSGFFAEGSLLYRACAHGILGVDVFFAISGFLICGLLLREYEADGDISLRRFYIRRCFRILPPYYAALAVFSVVSLLGIIPLNHADLPSCLLFYRNYMPLGTGEPGGFYTAHFWTLAMEEHFYLLWPMLLLVVKPHRAGKAAFLLAMLVFCWRVVEGHFQLLADWLPQANLLTRTDTRMDGLLWGCLAAIYFPRIQRLVGRVRFSQLWLVPLALLVVTQIMHVPALTLWRAILFPVLLVSTVTQPASWLGRALEWQPIRWIGTLAFSLYLWQELFLPEIASVMAPGAFRELQRPPWNLLALLVAAALSRYLIEIPMNRMGHRLSASPLTPAKSAASVLRSSYFRILEPHGQHQRGGEDKCQGEAAPQPVNTKASFEAKQITDR